MSTDPIIAQIKETIVFDQLLTEYFPESKSSHGMALCPFHDDTSPSLKVKEDVGFCHGGCSGNGKPTAYDVFSLYMKRHGCDFKTAKKALAERAGIDLKLSSSGRRAGKKKVIATYNYHGLDETLLFQVRKYDVPPGSKGRFSQHRPDGQGDWFNNLEGVQPVLFGLPYLVNAQEIWIAEGEKDAVALSFLGLDSTTAPMGAGKWDRVCVDGKPPAVLEGKCIVICRDNDGPKQKFAGQRHAETIAKSLHGVASSVKILDLTKIWPDLPEKGDVSDLIAHLGEDAAEKALRKLAEETREFDPAADSVLEDEKSEADEKKHGETKFQRLMSLFNATGAQPFKDQYGTGWVCINRSGFHENIKLKGEDFKDYLGDLYYSQTGEPIGPSNIDMLCSILNHRAKLEVRELHNRYCYQDARLLIDMGTDTWESIEVTPNGWKIVNLEKPPFRRHSHQRPFPTPEAGGKIQDLLEFIPCKDEGTQILLMVWVCCCFLEHVPRPGIVLHGPPNAGKSTTAEFLRCLVDSSILPLATLPPDEKELGQVIDHHAVISLDNLGVLKPWASDCLCRAVTGGGNSRRALFTNDDDFVAVYKRSFILTGVNVAAQNSDLLDRSILTEQTRFEGSGQRDIHELKASFAKVHGRLFGAILSALSGAMSVYPTIELTWSPRMKDFTRWGVAVAEVTGIGKNAFISAYQANIGAQHSEIVSTDIVAQAITKFMANKSQWEGSPSELYSALAEIVKEGGEDKSKGWPKAANAMSRRLTEIGHNLGQVGLMIDRSRAALKSRTKRIIITNTDIAGPSEQSSGEPTSTVVKHVQFGNRLPDGRQTCSRCNYEGEPCLQPVQTRRNPENCVQFEAVDSETG
jgi:hypothetical protein